jgi:N-acetylneuraminate epimerase
MNPLTFPKIFLTTFYFLYTLTTMAQTPAPSWSSFPALPDSRGFASMYAGVSHGTILAMGGANFPEKYPWEGGTKKWYNHIYAYHNNQWQLLTDTLPEASGYGVSVSYKEKVIIVGGSTPTHHLTTVMSYEWVNGQLQKQTLPALPEPLAMMTGNLLGSCIVLMGGSNGPTDPPLKKALVLDLEATEKGWQEIDAWPGPERLLPASGVHNNRLFLMGGETTAINAYGEKYRHILLDNYALTLEKVNGKWQSNWQKMATIPRGVTAAGTLPLLQSNKFLVWGGVDAVTAQYRTPATHPGIGRSMLYYYPDNDTWEYIAEQRDFDARVTLAVIPYLSSWLYISGEIKPGIRTPSIVQVQ